MRSVTISAMTTPSTRTAAKVLGLSLAAFLLSACGARPLPPPPDRSGLPTPGPLAEWAPPPVTAWTMSNGLEVWYLQQTQAPLVAMHLVLPSGAATDPEGKSGVTAMMIDMLDEGAGDKDALQLSLAWKSLATDYGASPATDGVFFSLNMLADKVDPSLALLGDILFRPTFPEDEFERRKAQRLAQATAQEADPGSAQALTMRRALYAKGYGGMPAGGIKTTLQTLTLDDVKAQYAAVIKPKGARLIVVGAIEEAALKAALETTFAAWTGEPTASNRALTTPPSKAILHVIDFPGSTQSSISVARRVPGSQATDTFEVRVFNQALGGAFTSRLNLNLREDKGYTYGARSGFSRWRQAGVFTLGAKVKSETTADSFREIFKELANIRGGEPLTQKERDSAVNGMLLGFPGSFETMEGVAGQLSSLALDDLPMSYLRDFSKKVAAVTAEAANTAGNKYTQGSEFQVIVAGDWAALKASLDGLELPVQFHDAQGNPIELSPPAAAPATAPGPKATTPKKATPMKSTPIKPTGKPGK